MFGIGTTELLIIMLVALIVLGPTKLPGIARSLGKALGEFRRVTTDVQRTLNLEAAKIEEDEKQKTKPKAATKTKPQEQDAPAPPSEAADSNPNPQQAATKAPEAFSASSTATKPESEEKA